MRYFILIILLQTSALLTAQNIKSFSSAHHFYGKGKIGNSEISLELDFIFRYAYANGCITQDYYQITGNYYYNQYGIPIHLIGKTTTPDLSEYHWFYNRTFEVTLYELSSDYEKRAVFKGNISLQDFQGEWIDQTSDKHLTFAVDWEESNFGNLKVKWNSREYILPDLHNLAHQGQYQLLRQIEKDHKLYLFLKVELPACGAYNCRGSSCGGSDIYLYWYCIGEQSIEWQKIPIYQETPYLDIEEMQINQEMLICISKDFEYFFRVEANYNFPEKGLTRIQTPLPNESNEP